MATLNIGRVRPWFSGKTWNAVDTYEAFEAITHDDELWLAVQDVPANNQPDTSPSYWVQFTEKGADGATGPEGPQGPQGIQGPEGPSNTPIGETNWHSGSDGPASGLDADLLDGLQGTAYSRLASTNVYTGSNNFTGDLQKSGNDVATEQYVDNEIATLPGVSGQHYVKTQGFTIPADTPELVLNFGSYSRLRIVIHGLIGDGSNRTISALYRKGTTPLTGFSYKGLHGATTGTSFVIGSTGEGDFDKSLDAVIDIIGAGAASRAPATRVQAVWRADGSWDAKDEMFYYDANPAGQVTNIHIAATSGNLEGGVVSVYGLQES